MTSNEESIRTWSATSHRLRIRLTRMDKQWNEEVPRAGNAGEMCNDDDDTNSNGSVGINTGCSSFAT